MPFISSRSNDPPPSPGVQRFVCAILTVLLLGFATGMIYIGVGAIEDQHYEWFSGRRRGSGTRHLATGADAVRMGIGFIAFGSLFATWAAGLILYMVNAEARATHWPRFWSAYTWTSAGLILLTLLSFAPPWHAASLLLYGTLLTWGAFWFAVVTRRVPPAAGAIVFFACGGACVALVGFIGESVVWIILGALASMILLAHIPTAAPKLWARIEAALKPE